MSSYFFAIRKPTYMIEEAERDLRQLAVSGDLPQGPSVSLKIILDEYKYKMDVRNAS